MVKLEFDLLPDHENEPNSVIHRSGKLVPPLESLRSALDRGGRDEMPRSGRQEDRGSGKRRGPRRSLIPSHALAAQN